MNLLKFNWLRVLNDIWFNFSSDCDIAFESLWHPNYLEEITKGNMPTYEKMIDHEGNEVEYIDTELWSEYVEGRSSVEQAMIMESYRQDGGFMKTINNILNFLREDISIKRGYVVLMSLALIACAIFG